MAHPKRRTSKARKGIRRSHLALKVTAPHHCPRCGVASRAHRVCDNCGFYGFEKGGQKGEEVLQKEEY
jgi:large subunit ribosomal protein L32